MQPAIVAVNILLVQGPTDALHGPALHLPLDIVGVHGFVCVLKHGVEQNGGEAGFRVNVQINQMHTKADASAIGIDFMVACNRSAGAVGHRGDYGNRHGLKIACIWVGRFCEPVLPDYRVLVYVPKFDNPFAHLLDGVPRRFDGGQTDSKGYAAAIGDIVVTQRTGIGDDGVHVVIRGAQFLGCALVPLRAAFFRRTSSGSISSLVPIRQAAASSTFNAVATTAPMATWASVQIRSLSNASETPAETTAMSISVCGIKR